MHIFAHVKKEWTVRLFGAGSGGLGSWCRITTAPSWTGVDKSSGVLELKGTRQENEGTSRQARAMVPRCTEWRVFLIVHMYIFRLAVVPSWVREPILHDSRRPWLHHGDLVSSSTWPRTCQLCQAARSRDIGVSSALVAALFAEIQPKSMQLGRVCAPLFTQRANPIYASAKLRARD